MIKISTELVVRINIFSHDWNDSDKTNDELLLELVKLADLVRFENIHIPPGVDPVEMRRRIENQTSINEQLRP